PPADPIRQPAPQWCEDKRHRREARHQKSDLPSCLLYAKTLGINWQQRQHHPESQQVDEHRQKDNQQRSTAGGRRRGLILLATCFVGVDRGLPRGRGHAGLVLGWCSGNQPLGGIEPSRATDPIRLRALVAARTETPAPLTSCNTTKRAARSRWKGWRLLRA